MMELIRGQVTNLVLTKGSSDPVFEGMDKSLAGLGAVAAAAAGQLPSSTILANASQGAAVDVEFFTCVVNDLRLFGHLHRVEFKAGDEMEFVIERYLGRGSVQAARSPAHRLIWMRPYQTRGLMAQQKNNTKWRYIVSFLGGSIPTAFFLFFLPEDKNSPLWFYPAIFLGIFLTTLGISFLITRRFHAFSLVATEVIRAFGYDTPESVDLPALSTMAEQKLRDQAATSPMSFQPWRFHY
jgi:hypothetical protein